MKGFEDVMKVRAAVVQMTSKADLKANLVQASSLVEKAVASRAELIGLPENFAYLGSDHGKVALAEEVSSGSQGPILGTMRELARKHRVTLVLGGMPEKSGSPDQVYNACVVLGPNGRLLAKYRKIHLFDVDLPQVQGGGQWKESETVIPGQEAVTVDIPWGRVGLTVCYDLRFPELYRTLSSFGALAFFVPAAFTHFTGKDHWEALLRARAIENQAYVLAPAQVGKHSEGRDSWGHAMIVDPWGLKVASVEEGAGVAIADLDTEYIRRVRGSLPVLEHRRL